MSSPGCRHLDIIAFEKGDEPEGAVDVHPELLNSWQKAKHALTQAETAITTYLNETEQKWQ